MTPDDLVQAFAPNWPLPAMYFASEDGGTLYWSNGRMDVHLSVEVPRDLVTIHFSLVEGNEETRQEYTTRWSINNGANARPVMDDLLVQFELPPDEPVVLPITPPPFRGQ